MQAQQIHGCARRPPKKPGQRKPRGPSTSAYGAMSLSKTPFITWERDQIQDWNQIDWARIGLKLRRTCRDTRGLKLNQTFGKNKAGKSSKN